MNNKGTVIISAWDCLGKTTFAKAHPDICQDIESIHYSRIYPNKIINDEISKGDENFVPNPDYPQNYINDIVSNLGKYKFILITLARLLLDRKYFQKYTRTKKGEKKMRTQTTSRCLIVQGDSIVLCKHLEGGYYFLPGGGLELGETLNQCITRELNEEMGLAESDIIIHDGILLAIENQGYDSKGNFLYGIEVVKRVDINTEEISSKEDLIGFEKIKISDLKDTKLYPVVIKNWVIETLGQN